PYPPLLCTAGLKDDRVPYWEPAKLIAALRERSSSGNPAVLLLNPASGHQESDDRNAALAHMALLWAFARRCVALAQHGWLCSRSAWPRRTPHLRAQSAWPP